MHPADLADLAAVTALARALAPGLVVVGPEAPLVAGLADLLRAPGIACFGPSRRAAMIEGSKSFAKQVMSGGGHPDRRCPDLRAPRRRWPSALAGSGPRTW